jgi:Ca2+-binding RTX toxin-like protein
MAGRSNDDRIFGDAGDDYITGDRGADRIAGGSGNDQLFGNLGPDVVSGGPGDDRINVVRGEVDEVRCGAGRDVVHADAADKVARDCEVVHR